MQDSQTSADTFYANSCYCHSETPTNPQILPSWAGMTHCTHHRKSCCLDYNIKKHFSQLLWHLLKSIFFWRHSQPFSFIYRRTNVGEEMEKWIILTFVVIMFSILIFFCPLYDKYINNINIKENEHCDKSSTMCGCVN